MGASAFASPQRCADFAGHMVTGLGSYSHGPRALFRQGCEAAIFEARVCAITGRFSDGEECWVRYGGCSNGAFVDARMSDDISAFADSLRDQYEATGTCCSSNKDQDHRGPHQVMPSESKDGSAK